MAFGFDKGRFLTNQHKNDNYIGKYNSRDLRKNTIERHQSRVNKFLTSSYNFLN